MLCGSGIYKRIEKTIQIFCYFIQESEYLCYPLQWKAEIESSMRSMGRDNEEERTVNDKVTELSTYVMLMRIFLFFSAAIAW